MGMNNETAIKEKALGLWSRRGYSAVGIQEICTLSGITKPTLYHYFGSKQGLLAQILDSGYGLLCPILESQGAYQGNMDAALKSWSDIWMQDAVKNPDFFRLTLALGVAPPDSEEAATVSPWYSRIVFSLITLFENATRDHGNMKGRAQTYALSFFGLMQTHGNMVLNRRLSWTEDYAQKTLHYFKHGIYS